MQALAPLLDVPLDSGVARLELDHRVARRFRWLVLLELALALTVGVCALPLVVLLVVFGGGGELVLPDLDEVGRRAWVRWREVHGRVVGADGTVQTVPGIAVDQERYGRALGELLQRADAARVTVVERISGGAPVAIWFGGQPLLQAPEALDSARAQRVLHAEGITVQTADDRLRLTLPRDQPGTIAAWLGLVLLGPLLLWTAGGRARLGALWDATQGRAWTHCLEVDAGGLLHVERRGDRELSRARVDRADLLGLAWGPLLSDGPQVRRTGPLLRLVSRQNTVDIDVPADHSSGAALRELLVIGAQRLWHLPAAGSAPAHCPYCATLYPFAPGATCPSCGAPPLALHGLAPSS